MEEIRISCAVNPSEDESLVRDAVANIFPSADLVMEDGRLTGHADLVTFSKLIRRQRILDTTRSVLIKNRDGDRTRMYLNKQVATVGKVSFTDRRAVLGPIEVTIVSDEMESLIDRVSPVTVDGEEVKV
ncbi:MAG: hypothetical protein IJ856_03270 [Candidatus Methanomethylophilaceae archaeon]|nr:hypothetical protein [Candidatus Methanomethylophilaceae archaeon]